MIRNNAFPGCSSHGKSSFQVFVFGLALILTLPFASIGKEKSKSKEKPVKPESHRFFSFEESQYFTSSDKRIGVKLLIDSSRVGPTYSSLQHITLLPGAHVKSHRHVYATEVIYLLKGNLTLRIEKETKVMGPDTTAYIPPQGFHEFLNDSADVCQLLQFYSPSGPEEEYRSWEKPADEGKKADSPTSPPPPSQPPFRKAPPLVPGSPEPTLGGVKDISGSQTTEFNLDLGKKVPPKKSSDQKLDLNLKKP